jgi:hypothetical protein
MAGDNNFRWYWGIGEAPEEFHGPFASGDAAMRAAQADRPASGFLLVEADRMVPTVAGVFGADDVLKKFEDLNNACWLTGGMDVVLTTGEKEELEAKLADCLHRWLRKHGLDERTMLHSIRTKDYFGAAEVGN